VFNGGSGGAFQKMKFLVMLVLGALSGLAMPPVDAWWILGITIPLFLKFFQTERSLFVQGWLFGFGYFIAVLHWIGFAFFVDAKVDLWMMPFSVGGLAGVLAIYWGLVAWATHKLVQRGFAVWLVFPLTLSIAEWLRGILFTGFPWAVPGLAADGMGGVAQLAAFIGMNGLTLVILLWAAMPFAYFAGYKKIAGVVLLTLPLAWSFGEWRLAQNPTQFVAGVGVRLVQPNISQSDKWRGDNARAIFDQLLALSAKPPENGIEVTHIIWPESAVPFLIDESPEGKAELRAMLGGKKVLLTGAVRRSSPRPINDVEPEYFTSVLVFDGNAQVVASYDKWHLVPGGEYLPLAWLLEPLGFRKVVSLPESFTAGRGPEAILIPGAGRALPQICYEAIFPESITDSVHRPDWIVNVTNDGWFGNSAGPYQHLAQLRLRAVEQGLPAMRAANTGISAVIDPVGRYLETIVLGTENTRDSSLPKKLQSTVYSVFGDFSFLALLLLAASLGIILKYMAFGRMHLN
jgi:apolipoprotein N-acyltransferase